MIQHFYRWLQQEIPARKLPAYILGFVLLLIVINQIVFAVIISVFSPTLPELLNLDDVLWFTPFFLILCSLVEELIFRGPLYFKKLRSTPARLVLSILVSSAIFGVYHGTFWNIAIQGISGIGYSILFLKGGGMQRKFWRGIAVSTAAHAFFDCILWAAFVASILYS